MRQDVYGDVRVALRSLQVSPLYGAAGRHKPVSGAKFKPDGYSNPNVVSFTPTATRIYYLPFAVQGPLTFSGVSLNNSDTSANTKKCRIMIYGNDVPLSSGAALLKDFGEITFGATAIDNQLLSAYTPPVGVYWLAVWFNFAVPVLGMYPAYPASASAGFTVGPTFNEVHGIIGGSISSTNYFQCHYVDLAYSTAPVTSPAPTATLVASLAGSTTAGTVPLVQLIVA